MKVYFSGIGGVGIGPLAEIAHDAGYQVDGSDQHDGLLTTRLSSKHIPFKIYDQDGSYLAESHKKQPIDLFVYTAALPEDHPELQLAHKLGIKTVKRDQLLARIIKDKGLKLIAVAGTHGKTTTTSMLVWMLEQLKQPVSYSIGTTIGFGASGKYDPKSEYFIYECDEFDRNFLHFYPYLALLPSVDYDHPDVYLSKEDYDQAFAKFISQSRRAITWQSQLNSAIEKADNLVTLDDSLDQIDGIKLPGQKTRANASLAIAGLRNLGFDQDLVSIINRFPGTDRRFERLAPNLYTDYGHHPSEIAATLEMASELSDHVVLVYQPHQNVRQFALQKQYTNQFEQAEKIYWLPTYLTREDPKLPILTPTQLFANLTNKQVAEAADLSDALWNNISRALDSGKLVLVMGAGTVDGWVRQHLNQRG